MNGTNNEVNKICELCMCDNATTTVVLNDLVYDCCKHCEDLAKIER